MELPFLLPLWYQISHRRCKDRLPLQYITRGKTMVFHRRTKILKSRIPVRGVFHRVTDPRKSKTLFLKILRWSSLFKKGISRDYRHTKSISKNLAIVLPFMITKARKSTFVKEFFYSRIVDCTFGGIWPKRWQGRIWWWILWQNAWKIENGKTSFGRRICVQLSRDWASSIRKNRSAFRLCGHREGCVRPAPSALI